MCIPYGTKLPMLSGSISSARSIACSDRSLPDGATPRLSHMSKNLAYSLTVAKTPELPRKKLNGHASPLSQTFSNEPVSFLTYWLAMRGRSG